MSIVIHNNMPAQESLSSLIRHTAESNDSLKKVASGLKVSEVADDVAAFSVSERLQVQFRGLSQDRENGQNAQNLLRTAEGALSNTIDVLRTMKAKAIDAANDTNSEDDRATIQKEVDRFIEQINDNAAVTYNGKGLLDGSYADAGQGLPTDFIVKALNSEWLSKSLDLVKQTTGLGFDTDGATVKEMKVEFKSDGALDSRTLAQVESTSVNGKTDSLSLQVNMDIYSDTDPEDPNGKAGDNTYLDRVIAHEMTHAVMAANIDHFADLPLFLKEGAAEMVHGIDDERKDAIKAAAGSAASLDSAMNEGTTSGADESQYAGGYVFFRYMAAKTGGDANIAVKNFMGALSNSKQQGVAAIDEALKVSTGFESLSALKTQMKADRNASDSAEDFLMKYCNIDLGNKDTGAIVGYDARGKRPATTAESVVPESANPSGWEMPLAISTKIRSLTIRWPGVTSDPETSLSFQVGTKPSQILGMRLGDMRAEALGLTSARGQKVDLRTRDGAISALKVFDDALEKAVNQQTTIGAIQSRLHHTLSTITAADENTRSSESNIRDADMAREILNMTRSNMLSRASQSMLANANQDSENALTLLQ